MLKFEIGITYTGRFISDSNTEFSFEVIKRTAKRITVRDTFTGEVKTLGVSLDHNGNEMSYPYGRYSMCPTLRADRFD